MRRPKGDSPEGPGRRGRCIRRQGMARKGATTAPRLAALQGRVQISPDLVPLGV